MPWPDSRPWPDANPWPDTVPWPVPDTVPWPVPDTQPWLVPDSGLLGPTWTQLPISPTFWPGSPYNPNPSIWGVSASEIYLLIDNILWRCEDRGNEFYCSLERNLTGTDTLHHLGGFGSEVYAVGDNATILKKSASWGNTCTSAVCTYQTPNYLSIWCDGASDCFAGGQTVGGAQNPTIYVSVFDAQYQYPQDDPSAIRGTWGTGSFFFMGVGFKQGTGCRAWHFYSASFTPTTPAGCAGSLYDVWGTNNSNAFAVGAGGYHARFAGSGWVDTGNTGSDDLLAVWGSGPSDVWAVGKNNRVVHFNGAGWSTVTTGLTANTDLTDLWGLSGTNLYAVGTGGAIYRYR